MLFSNEAHQLALSYYFELDFLFSGLSHYNFSFGVCCPFLKIDVEIFVIFSNYIVSVRFIETTCHAMHTHSTESDIY